MLLPVSADTDSSLSKSVLPMSSLTLFFKFIVVIFFILVLIFGAKRLSGLGRGMGQAIKGFKEEVKDPDDQKSED